MVGPRAVNNFTPGLPIWYDQNRTFDKEVDSKGKERMQISKAMEDVPFGDGLDQFGTWSTANIEKSRQAKNCVDLSILFGIFGHYFDLVSGSGASILSKGLKAVSSLFYGQRDYVQYDVLGRGSNFNLPDSEIENQDEAIRKTGFADDFMENDRQRVKYGERLTAKLGKLSTQTAKIKPLIYFMSEFLGDGAGLAARILVDLPASLWWRARMLASTLHANFATTGFLDLPKLWIKSMFTDDGVKQFETKKNELHDLSSKYFANLSDGTSTPKTTSKLGLYVQMLFHRIKTHWDGMWDPGKLVEDKVKKGIIGKGKLSEAEQKRISFVNFTGAVNGLLGCLALITFGPIRAIMSIFGVQKCMSFVSTVDTARKLMHLVNYSGRFFKPEVDSSRDAYGRLANIVYPTGGESNANDLTVEYYHAAKARHNNALINGFGMLGLTLFETGLNIFRSRFSEGQSSVIDLVGRINNSLILKFFSNRRQHWGRMQFVESIVKSKLQAKGIQVTDKTDLLSEMQKINMTKPEMEKILTGLKQKMDNGDLQRSEWHTGPLGNGFAKVSNFWDGVRGKFEEIGIRANPKSALTPSTLIPKRSYKASDATPSYGAAI